MNSFKAGRWESGSQSAKAPQKPVQRIEQYVLQEFLGQGSIALVWAAADESGNNDFVVKFPRNSDKALLDFKREIDVLRDLVLAEDEILDDLRLIPRVLKFDLEGEIPYIVMDRAKGRKVNVLLDKEGPLDEPTVLQIGWQFCRVLDLLHTKLDRGYDDMKLENIWWDEGNKRISVTDWNVVSEPGAGNIEADLNRFARLLFWMVIGTQIDRVSGQYVAGRPTALSEETIVERGGGQWKQLTYGMRLLLTDILVPPASDPPPYPTAKALEERTRWLAHRWQEDWVELASMARSGDQSPEDSLALVEIAARKGSVDDSLLTDARRRVLRASRLGQVRDHLQGQNADEAARLAREEAERGRDRLRGIRWFHVATAAQLELDQFLKNRETIFEALDNMDNGKYETARSLFYRLSYELGRTGAAVSVEDFHKIPVSQREPGSREYAYLGRDADFCYYMDQGSIAEREGEWAKAEEAFDSAWSLLKDLQGAEPAYAELLCQRKGAPLSRKEDVAHHIDTLEASQRHLQMARQAELYTDIALELERSLKANRGNAEALRFCQEKALVYLEAGDLEGAHRIAQAGLQFAPGMMSLRAIAVAASALIEARKAIYADEAWRIVLDNIQTVLELKRENVKLERIIKKSTEEILQKLVDQASRSSDEQFWVELEALLSTEHFPPGSALHQKAEELKEHREEIVRKGYELLLSQCRQALASASLDECRALHSQMQSLAHGLQRAEWKMSLTTCAEELQDRVRALEHRQEQEERLKRAALLLAKAATAQDFAHVGRILEEVEKHPLPAEFQARLRELQDALYTAKSNAEEVNRLTSTLNKIHAYLQEVRETPMLQAVTDMKELRLQAWWHCREILVRHPSHELGNAVLEEIRDGLYLQDVLLLGVPASEADDILPDAGNALESMKRQLQEGDIPQISIALQNTMERIGSLSAVWAEDFQEYEKLKDQHETAIKLRDTIEVAGKGDHDALVGLKSLLDAELPSTHWQRAASNLEGILDERSQAILDGVISGMEMNVEQAFADALRVKRLVDLTRQRAGVIQKPSTLFGGGRTNTDEFVDKVVRLLQKAQKEGTEHHVR